MRGGGYHSLFETFNSGKTYDAIVLADTLHHIENPSRLLSNISNLLAKDGELVMTVHNSFSLHRRIGVKLGLLKDEFSATPFGSIHYQPGHFSRESLQKLLEKNGFWINEIFGFYLKPFSYGQMSQLNLSENELEALFDIGREFEDIAFSIFVRATPRR